MYVHEGKRKFFITIREVREDNTLGESESFSVYESDIKMSREEFAKYLIDAINKTHKGEKL